MRISSQTHALPHAASSATGEGRGDASPAAASGAVSGAGPPRIFLQGSPFKAPSELAKSSSSAATPSASSASAGAPDYFTSQMSASTPSGKPMSIAMPRPGGSIHQVPPTPGPSDFGNDHPWAKMFGPGGTGAPPTPAPQPGQGTTGAAGNLGLPPARRLGLGGRQTKPSPLGSQSAAAPQGSAYGIQTMSASPLAASFEGNAAPTHPMTSQQAQSRPITGSVSLPIPPKHKATSAPNDMARFQAMEPEKLAQRIQSLSSTLVLDIRPTTSFSAARVRNSINVAAPTTLLKRPGITVQRIADEMLQSDEDRLKFSQWKLGPMKAGSDALDRKQTLVQQGGVDTIVVLDTDTSNAGEAGRPSVGGGGPCLLGLLRKFDAAGFAGNLCWLVGGFSRLCQLQQNLDVDMVENGHTSPPSRANNQSSSSQVSSGVKHPVSSLVRSDSRRQNSTPPSFSPVAGIGSNRTSLVQGGGLPREAFSDCTTTSGAASNGASNSATNLAVPQPQGSSAMRRTASSSTQACNPFFDNIRQNRELQHGITERVPLELDDLSAEAVAALPAFLRRIARNGGKDRAEELAQSFFAVEKAEQTRLMATMQQHSAESAADPRSGTRAEQPTDAAPSFALPGSKSGAPGATGPSDSSLAEDSTGPMQLSSPFCQVTDSVAGTSPPHAFPFSIAAAIERGSENRYNNIWTYEHSRVKVTTDRNCGGSDYLNGSFVEPMRQFGSFRRYIATQAPLPSTFETFWRAVWQQNSRTIAMLTREYESGRVQSHNYWSESEYGSTIQLKLLEETHLDAQGHPCAASGSKEIGSDDAGFFGGSTKPKNSESDSPVMILRKLSLSNSSSTEPARVITHLQFVGWPDYSIPSDPEALLVFMDMVSQSQHEAHLVLVGKAGQASQQPCSDRGSAVGPLMLHCSAGVGRTGTYVVIDTVLDVLRRNRRKQKGQPPLAVWDNNLSEDSARAQPAPSTGIEDVEMAPATPSRSVAALPPQTPERADKADATTSGSARHAWPRRPEDTPPLGGQTLSAARSATRPFHRTLRRSLKRELSPSADMDLDPRPALNGHGGSGDSTNTSTLSSLSGSPNPGSPGSGWKLGRRRSLASPPPMRRNRSSSSEVSVGINESSGEVEEEGARSDRSTRSGSVTSFTFGAAAPSSGWGRLGIRQPEGLDTPSRALDGMNLGLNSPSPISAGYTDLANRRSSIARTTHSSAAEARSSPIAVSMNSSAAAPSQGSSSGNSHSATAMASTSPTTSIKTSSSGNSSNATASSSPPTSFGSSGKTFETGAIASGAGGGSSGDAATTKALAAAASISDLGETDLVRHATDVAREQRMSSVQTQRQYVFCYLAVVKGVLREIAREG